MTLAPPLYEMKNCQFQQAIKLLNAADNKKYLSLSFWSRRETARRTSAHLPQTEPHLYQQLQKNLLQGAIKKATHKNCVRSKTFKHDVGAHKELLKCHLQLRM